MDASAATFTAVLTGRRHSGAGLSLVTLTPASDRAEGYRAPGQYIEVRASAKGYFALASEIGAPSWELLVRMNGGASDTLLRAPEGTELQVAGPHGRGFPLDDARGRPLVVAVAGSALAVARPILRARAAQGEAHRTRLYVGARTLGEVALGDEVAEWAGAGATVILCLSRTTLDDDGGHTLAGLRRANGYVQKVLVNDVVEGLVAESVVFAAGPSGMLEELRSMQRTHAPQLEVVTNV